MKIGDLVQYHDLIGLILDLDPFDDLKHTEIYWIDDDMPNGSIISVWDNRDFEVINEKV